MATVLENVLTPELLQSIVLLPEVVAAKERLSSSGKVSFSISLSHELRLVLQARFGLDLSSISDLPMRWIKGDTVPHVDSGASKFTNTYLAYVTNSPGSFVVDGVSYPIQEGDAYIFSEGLSHNTQETGNEPRLLLGPMNEFAEPVGGSVNFYYPSETDALANTNIIIAYGSYTIQSVSGYTQWRLASTSTGPSPQNVVYNVGDVLNGNNTTDFYYLYPANPCFLEGTQILCQVDGKDTYLPVEQLQKGTLVKTSLDGYKPIKCIGKGSLQNSGTDERSENRLYKCSPSKYPELKEDLYITGCHSILVDELTEQQRTETKQHLGRIFVTDKKYRLMACLDEKAEPWCSHGTYTIWHFALEHADVKMNYGVYANGGLLVETCSIHSMLNKSNMLLL
jgi:hypothetical protein